MKGELRGLPADLAISVGRYLVAAELARDPEQAYRYAKAARDLAARIGVVREVTGVAAYRSGRWAEALAELRAARRLTGRNEHLPLMADSERALGRLDRALDLVRSEEARRLPRAAQVELRIVESGIRRDQGMADAAVLVLQLPELTDSRIRPWSARLFYAYGDALLAARRPEDAREAFSRAVLADENEETDALSRLDELDGITVDDLESDDEDWEEDGAEDADRDDEADAEDDDVDDPDDLGGHDDVDDVDDDLDDDDDLEDDLDGEDDVVDDEAEIENTERDLDDEFNDPSDEDLDEEEPRPEAGNHDPESGDGSSSL